MRDARALAHDQLDGISAQLGEVLARADALLEEWSAFGDTVRRQVEREAKSIGDTVAGSIDRSTLAATTQTLERAFATELQTRLSSLGVELSRLEARARATARHVADDRKRDRTLAWIAILGILIANALLAMILLRDPPASSPIVMPHAEPERVPIGAPLPEATATPDPVPEKPSLLRKWFPTEAK